MMILTLLEIFGAAGFYGLAFVAVAYAAWELGVRDAFLLTVLALVLGGVLGFWLTVAFDKLVTKKRAADEQG